MPTYTYKCQCGATTDVVRAIKDIDLPPDNGCIVCGSTHLERTIIVDPKSKNFILNGGGWHDNLYTKTRSRN